MGHANAPRHHRADFLSTRTGHGPLRWLLFPTSRSKADAQELPCELHAGDVASRSEADRGFREVVVVFDAAATTEGEALCLRSASGAAKSPMSGGALRT